MTEHQKIREAVNRKGPQAAVRLGFFVPNPFSVKGRGGFHGNQRQELHHVVLKHVPQDTGLFVIISPVFNAEGFRGNNADMIDISAVPDGLKDGVGKAEHQYVLYGFFCQVMIDPEDLMFAEILMNTAVQVNGGLEVPSERLFHYQPRPAVLVLVLPSQPGPSQHLSGLLV